MMECCLCSDKVLTAKGFHSLRNMAPGRWLVRAFGGLGDLHSGEITCRGGMESPSGPQGCAIPGTR